MARELLENGPWADGTSGPASLERSNFRLNSSVLPADQCAVWEQLRGENVPEAAQRDTSSGGHVNCDGDEPGKAE